VSEATIRAAAVTLLAAVTGVRNVDAEEPIALDAEEALAARMYDGRIHFWLVKIEEQAPDFLIGAVELRHRVTIEGYLGVARDNPDDGTKSDTTAKQLQRAVLVTFTSKGNRSVTNTALDTQDFAPFPVRLVTVTVGEQQHRCHRLGLTFTAQENAA